MWYIVAGLMEIVVYVISKHLDFYVVLTSRLLVEEDSVAVEILKEANIHAFKMVL